MNPFVLWKGDAEMPKTIIVTGAGRGLGYHIVLRHLEMKDRVYAFDYQITSELNSLIERTGLLKVYHCDIASTESVNSAFREVSNTGEQIDILYNVAGIFRFEDKVGLAETDLDLCAAMYNINAVGALRVCKAVLPLLQSGTLIVNISSEAGSIGACYREQEYSYCMSKAALNMGAKILSNELARRSVRVINLHPGWMRTFMGGPESLKSKHSVSPEESAGHIVDIALNIDSIPKDQMYIQHTKETLPW
jgi:NAD(P)-dependent dehydrogenase (short-subunit alcohol dehydrogenase family)